MTDFIDSIYFQELFELDPANVCKRALCTYNDAERVYTVPIWGEPCKICPGRLSVEHVNGNLKEYQAYLDLFAVHYLLRAKEITPLNQWISEKDVPGGETFFRGPHEIPAGLITARFNNDISAFKGRCEQLSGVSVSLADAAFTFQMAPRIPVAVLYYAGDEELPAESKILYDKTIGDQLALDIIFALATGICGRFML